MVMKVGMQDLDKALSRIVDHARKEPVQVLRYARPWVWIVGHELWDRPASSMSLVPEHHPLRALRTQADAMLSENIAELYRLGESLRIDMPIDVAMRALMLQLVYSVRDEQDLAERIGYDLAFRWFVGLEMDQPVPEPPVLVAALLRLRMQHVVVVTLQRLMYEVLPPNLAEAQGKFVPDYGLLSLWMAPFLGVTAGLQAAGPATPG